MGRDALKPRIYVAGPWVQKAACAAFRDKLVADGFEVTSRWLDLDESVDNSLTPENLDMLMARAMDDIEDVLRADIFMLMNLEKSEGKAVETGIALMSQKGIVMLGDYTNVFQTLHFPKVESEEEAIKVLNDYPWMPGQKPFHLVAKDKKTALYRV